MSRQAGWFRICSLHPISSTLGKHFNSLFLELLAFANDDLYLVNMKFFEVISFNLLISNFTETFKVFKVVYCRFYFRLINSHVFFSDTLPVITWKILLDTLSWELNNSNRRNSAPKSTCPWITLGASFVALLTSSGTQRSF